MCKYIKMGASSNFGNMFSVVGGAYFLPFLPMAHFLGFTPLPAVFFLWMAAFLLAYSVLTHTVKMWFGRRFSTD